MRNLLVTLAFAGMVLGTAQAVITSTTQHDTSATAFDGQLSNTDLIAGQLGVEGADAGWHPANPNAADQLPIFTDGLGGSGGSGVRGLLNDFPDVGTPTKIVSYDTAGEDITGINILSGNDGADGRVFMSVAIYADNNFLAYVESDPLGTINNATSNQWASTFVRIRDDSGVLAAGVNDIRFEFYAVDNTGGQYRDAWDGLNPFTGVDDGLNAAFVSPLIWEIDVLPEPASLVLLGLAALMLRRR